MNEKPRFRARLLDEAREAYNQVKKHHDTLRWDLSNALNTSTENIDILGNFIEARMGFVKTLSDLSDAEENYRNVTST